VLERVTEPTVLTAAGTPSLATRRAIFAALALFTTAGVLALAIVAVPAITGPPLADGLERIAIIPANSGGDDLVATVRALHPMFPL